MKPGQIEPRAVENPHAGASIMTFGVLVVFCFAIGAAMGAYPGGTHYDHARVGYDFFQNFWCDALRNPALNGAPNARGARMASMAMWILSSGLLPFWGMAAELVAAKRSAARDVIRWLGVLAMLGMMGVTLLPSDKSQFLHGLLVTTAGPCGLIATALAVQQGWSSPRIPRIVGWLGAIALITALANIVEYSREFWFSAPPAETLPAIQKVASVSFLSWVLSLSALGFSGRARERRSPSRTQTR